MYSIYKWGCCFYARVSAKHIAVLSMILNLFQSRSFELNWDENWDDATSFVYEWAIFNLNQEELGL